MFIFFKFIEAVLENKDLIHNKKFFIPFQIILSKNAADKNSPWKAITYRNSRWFIQGATVAEIKDKTINNFTEKISFNFLQRLNTAYKDRNSAV